MRLKKNENHGAGGGACRFASGLQNFSLARSRLKEIYLFATFDPWSIKGM
jgi:hypothetical protein